MVKWLRLPVVVLGVAQLGWVVNPPASAPATLSRPPERSPSIPESVRAEDLSAWVLDAYVPPVVPLLRRPERLQSSFSWSVANRNNNPLNIKLGAHTRWLVEQGLATISDITPLDGGRFLQFASPATGFQAAHALLDTSRYRGLQVDRALRLWSNNGFGAEILLGTAIDAQGLIRSLGRAERHALLAAMATAEGYRSPTLFDDIARALTP